MYIYVKTLQACEFAQTSESDTVPFRQTNIERTHVQIHEIDEEKKKNQLKKKHTSKRHVLMSLLV